MSEHIWFVPQTGVVRFVEPQAPSNYYVFKLARGDLGKVELGIREAQVGSAGFEYPKAFLDWVEKAEKRAQRLEKLPAEVEDARQRNDLEGLRLDFEDWVRLKPSGRDMKIARRIFAGMRDTLQED